MDENKAQPVVHDDTGLSCPPKTNGAAVAEVNGNVVHDTKQDASVKSQKEVNWGGDAKEAASDDENQKPGAEDQAEAGTAVAVKKKKRKSKSKKKGLVRPSTDFC